MNVILIKTLQLLLCLSLLIVLHEGGHFGFAKLFKVRVEKFFMFFDYKFHLFSTRDSWFTRLFPRFKNNETEYGIGWIPLGGYVKIAGMVDESLDTEQLKQPAKPDEFRSQKVWKRFLIMVGGVLMNLLTAFVIYSGIMLANGEDRIKTSTITQGFAFNQEAEALGFRDGDILLRFDDEDVYLRNSYAIPLQDLCRSKKVVVNRNGQEVTIVMPEDGMNLIDVAYMQPPFMTPIAPALVQSVVEDTPAERAGMKEGCRLLAIDGCPIEYWNDYDSLYVRRMDVLGMKDCSRADSLRMRQMVLVFQNPGAEAPDTVSLKLDENYLLGVTRAMPDYELEHIDYNLLTCVPAGIRYGWGMLVDYVDQFRYVATPQGAKEVGSFIAIGNLFPNTWDWLRFWMLTAFISIALAVMNILPIPGLDGGHVMMLLYEAITGREPSEKVMVWFEYIGMGIIIALMLLAFGNDIRRFIL